MQFNQFQKELRDRGIDPQAAYMFTLVYERLIETEKQLTMASNLIMALTEITQNFVQLNEVQQRELKQFMRSGRPDGIEVDSVAIDPNERDN